MNPDFQPGPQPGGQISPSSPPTPEDEAPQNIFVSRPTPPTQARDSFMPPSSPDRNPMFTPSAPQGPQPLPPGSAPQPNIPSSDMPRPQPLPTTKLKKERNWLIIPLVMSVVFLLAAIGFGYWAFSERQDYKFNTDTKIEEANEVAVAAAITQKEAEFVEREKRPLKEYKGPAPFGSISLQYPKTWAAYIAEDSSGKAPINGYLHPNFVPDIEGETSFALRIEVINEPYEEVLSEFDSASDRGTVKISALQAEKVPQVTGARIDGEVVREKQGSVVLFPLRDKTLRISTQSQDFMKDFNEIILKNLSFTP